MAFPLLATFSPPFNRTTTNFHIAGRARYPAEQQQWLSCGLPFSPSHANLSGGIHIPVLPRRAVTNHNRLPQNPHQYWKWSRARSRDHQIKTENREAVKGQNRGNVGCAAREANPRRPVSTGAMGRREKARNGFGLLYLVAEHGTEPATTVRCKW